MISPKYSTIRKRVSVTEAIDVVSLFSQATHPTILLFHIL